MSSRQRIEQLTQTWYGFTVFAAAAAVIQVACWPLSAGLLFSPARLALTFVGSAVALVLAIGLNLVAAVFGLLMVRWIGRSLLAGSGFVRVGILVLSPVFAVLCGLSAIQQLWNGVSHLSVSPLVGAAVAAIAVTLHLRSFGVVRQVSRV